MKHARDRLAAHAVTTRVGLEPATLLLHGENILYRYTPPRAPLSQLKCNGDEYGQQFSCDGVLFVFRGVVYLKNLLYPVAMIHKASLVNDKGEMIGCIKVAVQLVTGNSVLTCLLD